MAQETQRNGSFGLLTCYHHIIFMRCRFYPVFTNYEGLSMEQKPKEKKQGFWSKIFPDNRSLDSTIIGIGLCVIFYIVVRDLLKVALTPDLVVGELGLTIFQGVKELVQMVVVGLFTKKAVENKINNGEKEDTK